MFSGYNKSDRGVTDDDVFLYINPKTSHPLYYSCLWNNENKNPKVTATIYKKKNEKSNRILIKFLK